MLGKSIKQTCVDVSTINILGFFHVTFTEINKKVHCSCDKQGREHFSCSKRGYNVVVINKGDNTVAALFKGEKTAVLTNFFRAEYRIKNDTERITDTVSTFFFKFGEGKF